MLISLVVGFALGIAAGLGIGGGSLLMLWLTLVKDTAQADARSINLLFFLAAAGAVSALRLKRGDLQWRRVLPGAVGGCIAAGICSLLSRNIDQQVLRTSLGILFLITGVRELFYRPTKDK